MKRKLPVLEFSVAEMTSPKKARWAFRFRTPEGEILIESAANFGSRIEAERGFVSLIKSVASNEYQVEYPPHSFEEAKSSRRRAGSFALKARGHGSACPSEFRADKGREPAGWRK